MEKHWLKRGLVSLMLLPLSWVFSLLAGLRRHLYRSGGIGNFFTVYRAPVPVVVVGNITAGGSGKTPLVIAIAKLLSEQGYRPGVVCRGYRANSQVSPLMVTAATPTVEGGDEPVMIAGQAGCPVVVHRRRDLAVQHLLANASVDLILCDDGLQHYALARDIEIAVVSQAVGLGNRFLLPAGPLREPPSRLADVDFVIESRVSNQSPSDQSSCAQSSRMASDISKRSAHDYPTVVGPIYFYHLRIAEFVSLDGSQRVSVESVQTQGVKAFNHTSEQPAVSSDPAPGIVAMAGIAYPVRFFDTLSAMGLAFIPQPRSDHHTFTASDFIADDAVTGDQSVIWLITAKDATKCRELAIDQTQIWYAEAIADLDANFEPAFQQRLSSLVG